MKQTRTQRRRRWCGAVAALVLPFAVVTAPAAFAEDGPWNIDGIVADAGATALTDPYGNVKELGPDQGSDTKIGVIHDAIPPMLAPTNPNNQVDLSGAWLGTQRAGTNQDGDIWLYFAWSRVANSGSGFIAYEFMQSPPPEGCDYDGTDADLVANCNPWEYRKAGDFMILWDQQGGSRDLYLRTWSEVDGKLVLSPPGDPLDETISQAKYSADGYEGEAAVNLSETVFKGTTACLSFANTIPSTVTGNSDTADYKDTILKQTPPITNCGSLIVKKIVINDDGGLKKATDFSFNVNDGTATAFLQDPELPLNDLRGLNTLTDLKGTYTVTEPAVSGYTTSHSGDCTNVVIGPGDVKTCTITNDDQPGTLIVKKVVINDNGGSKVATDFSFNWTPGGTLTGFTQEGSDPKKGLNSLTVDAGKYTVTEPAVTGYTTTYDNCSNVEVTNGGTATCTITNDDQQGTLIVKKVVVNDNGGEATADDFTFTYGLDGGQSTITATFEDDGSNSIPVDAGTYDVSETPITGYTPSYACDNIVVPNGGSAECTITNDDQQGTLIVHKQVVNDNGGTLEATDFSFQVNGGDATAFLQDGDQTLKGKNSLTLNAGTYTVTEPDVAGYTSDVSGCASVTVTNGGSAECTITNDDQQGTLIVHKQVVNDNGGTLRATDFSFQVNGGGVTGFLQDGDDVLMGKNSLTVDSGYYTVTEPAVTGYTPDVSDCANVFVPSGGTGECTITNDDQQGTLIVHKQVVNDNGGTLKATDFSFQVNGGTAAAFLQDGDDVLKGKNTLTVDSGSYTVTEPEVPGYSADVSACAGVFVPNGLTAECTITNDDQPGTLIVKKVVINDNGGGMTASDFAFDYGLVGGTMTNQLFEGDGVNEVTVNAGLYNVTEPAAFGYTTTYDNCENVAVPNGGSATCTITNDDQPGTLIVNKLVVNDNGDTKVATDFAFEVNGGDPVPFIQNGVDILKGKNTLTVDAGTYVVTEPAVPGYTADVSDCANVVVANGASSECTIVNDDSKASPTGSTTQRWVLHDSLTINQLRPGAPDAAPEVTFKLFSSNTCSLASQVGVDESATLSGTTATTSTGVLVTVPGTYYWTVSYPGDQYNNPFTTECGKEYTTITAANE